MLATLSRRDGHLTLEYAGERTSRSFSACDREQLEAVARAFDDAHGVGSEDALPWCGRALSRWLDGCAGWLARLLGSSSSDVRLHIEDAEALADATGGLLTVPWELLWAGDTYVANNERRRFSIVRRVQTPHDARLPNPGPLGILFAAPSPGDLALLDFESEQAAIAEATEGLAVSLHFDDSGTLADYGDAVRQAHANRAFDVLHLACHAEAQPRPRLMFEDVVGLADGVEPRMFVEALGGAASGLGLLTLSSCATAGTPPHATHLPLALALVHAGVPAVLGWAERVNDVAAAQFSAALYRHLALRPASLEHAVAAARLALLRDPRRHMDGWYMPRLFTARPLDEPLCVPSGPVEGPAQVATSGTPLFGRRREVRSLVSALREGGRGIVVHGLGGAGKTALVCAALERLRRPGGFRTVDLRGGLGSVGPELLDPNRPLPPILVLEGFEALLEPVPGELHRIGADTRPVIEELVRRVRADATAVLIVVSRHDFRGLGHREGQGLSWLRLSLGELDPPAVDKWLRRLRIPFGVAEPFELLQRSAIVAAGQPALLRCILDAVARDPEDWSARLDTIEAGDYSPLSDVLSELAIPAVAAQLADAELSLLLDVLTFDAPLPRRCLVALCHHLGVDPAAIDRLCGLGAWSELPDPLDPARPACVRNQIVVDWLLASGLAAPDDDRARKVAASVLSLLRAYWRDLERGGHLERYRLAHQLAELALLIRDGDLAAEIAAPAVLWARQWRTREDAQRLSAGLLELLDTRQAADPCTFLFVCVELHENGSTPALQAAIFARIEAVLQDIDVDEHSGAPDLLYELAHFLRQQDSHARALELLARAHAVWMRRGDPRECALVRTEMLMITAELGDFATAWQGLEREVLPVFRELGDLRDLAGSLRTLAGLAFEQGRLDEAWDLAAQAIAAYERLGAWDRWADAQRIRVDVLMARGHAEDALKLCREQVLPVCEALTDDDWLLGVGWSLIHVLSHVRALAEAEHVLADRILPVVLRRGGPRDPILVWSHLADIVEERGQIARCLGMLAAELRPRFEALADDDAVVRVNIRCARLLTHMGQVERAAALCAESLVRVEVTGDTAGLAELHGVLALIADRQGELERALEIRLNQEIPLYEQLADERSLAIAYGNIAELLVALGRYADALEIQLERELPVYAELADTRSYALALSGVARTRTRLGQLAAAEQLLRDEVLPVLAQLGELRELAIAHSRLADILATRGEYGAARLLVERQVGIFERLADRPQLARAKRRIADVLLAAGDLVGSLSVREREELPIWETLADHREASVARALVAGTRAAVATENDRTAARAGFVRALNELSHCRLRHSDELWPSLVRLGVREQAITDYLAGRCAIEVLTNG